MESVSFITLTPVIYAKVYIEIPPTPVYTPIHTTRVSIPKPVICCLHNLPLLLV